MKNEKYIMEEDKKELIQIIQTINESEYIKWLLGFIKDYLKRRGR